MRRVLSFSVALALGCGPTIAPVDDGSGSAESGIADGPVTSTSTSSSSSTSTTTTVDSTFGDPNSTSIDSGIDFIMDPDGGGVCLSCRCDTWAQDCPKGEKCSAWANDGGDDWNAFRCSPIARDPGQPGDPCTVEDTHASGVDDCDLGSMCWDVDVETLEGTCVALCGGDEAMPTCESPDDDCFYANDGALNLCLPRCDPLLGDCLPTQVCLITYQSSFVCVSTASGIGAGPGEDCGLVYDCQPGLACLAGGEVSGMCGPGGCCTPYCDLAAPDPAASCFDPAQACTAWAGDEAPPELQDVGVCTVI